MWIWHLYDLQEHAPMYASNQAWYVYDFFKSQNLIIKSSENEVHFH